MFELTAYVAVWSTLGIGVGALDRLVNGPTLLSRGLLRGGAAVLGVAVLAGPVLQIGWAS